MPQQSRLDNNVTEDDITRGQEETEDGEEVRVYRYNGNGLISVTSVLDMMDEDEDDGGLAYWRSRNDGLDDNAYWRHLFWYKRHRGTLAHYRVLNELTDRELWSDDEEQSTRELSELLEDDVQFKNERDDEKHKKTKGLRNRRKNALYSVYRDQGGVRSRGEFCDSVSVGESAILDKANEDIEAFEDIFWVVAEQLGINADSALSVEQMMFDYEVGVAGQVDLVYENPQGDTVLADLKTSSGLRDHYPYQASAYGRVVDEDIDRYEIIRIHPDKGRWQVHAAEPRDPVESDWKAGEPEELFDEFYEVVERVRGSVQ